MPTYGWSPVPWNPGSSIGPPDGFPHFFPGQHERIPAIPGEASSAYLVVIFTREEELPQFAAISRDFPGAPSTPPELWLGTYLVPPGELNDIPSRPFGPGFGQAGDILLVSRTPLLGSVLLDKEFFFRFPERPRVSHVRDTPVQWIMEILERVFPQHWVVGGVLPDSHTDYWAGFDVFGSDTDAVLEGYHAMTVSISVFIDAPTGASIVSLEQKWVELLRALRAGGDEGEDDRLDSYSGPIILSNQERGLFRREVRSGGVDVVSRTGTGLRLTVDLEIAV